jgi:immune inhibitor A
MKAKWFSTFLIVMMLVIAMVPAAGAASDRSTDPNSAAKQDNLPHPKGEEQAALRAIALEAKLLGKTNGNTHEVARGQFVELAREGEDSIWTVLGEFNDLAHNTIPEPDRNVDNSTIWTEDFSETHFEDLLFSEASGAISMRNFYIELSSNRYTVNGDVTDWVSVPGNAASYNDDLGGPAVWGFVNDSVDGWYANSGMSPTQIGDYLSQFDVWDRYDYNGNGNFNEPDGYIDHFQSVHAGMGEEVGGGILGVDAIWSHRWYVYFNANGPEGTGPHGFGGIEIGDSGYWIGDYTIEPENGGVGVFAHEFGHDLGLPDLYDTSGGENSTGFWTLMSSGSYGNDGTEDIGSKPIHMGMWEKFQLGWLNYEVAFAGAKSEHRLGPATTNTRQAQGLFVVLLDKEVASNLGAPFAGSSFYYSGAGDDLDNSMYRSFTLPAGASLTAQVRYSIELDWDYAYLIASTDGGATWTNVATNLSTNTSPNGQNFGQGITGSSSGNWVNLTADLSAFTGNVLLGFRYWTDGAVVETGFQVDEISVTGSATDGAESDAGWTFDPEGGFRVTTGTESQFFFNAYAAEFRQYRGYDDSLRTGPYNFGFLNTLPNWVEHFQYQDGLLISYWDTSFTDNNTSQHPGGGLILPIDAHPTALIRPVTNTPWRARVQTFDSTFSLQNTDAITLNVNGVPRTHPSLPGVSVFNDATDFWDPSTPLANVITPNTGTTIRIKSISAQGGFMQVAVNK